MIKVRKDDLQFVKNLATNYKLVPLLERAVERWGDDEWSFEYQPKQEDDAWHPSGHCTPSIYDLYMSVKHPEKDDRSRMHKTFMVGHFWHQYLQWVMEVDELVKPENIERRGLKGWGEMGSKQDEVRYFPHLKDPILWKPYHWASGAADIAPCTIPGHGDYLIDFKTMKSMDFRRQDPPAWAVDKWECQANVYLDFFDLDKAIFVGINKDSPHDLKEWEFHKNQPLIDAIYQKWELVGMCLEEGIEPPQDEDIELPLRGPEGK